jgi:glycerol-3-phosphate O-acyltransferase / dihydroxyacetone phosphate acyltransferase
MDSEIRNPHSAIVNAHSEIMNLFLRFIYFVSKNWVWLTLRLYYRHVLVLNQERLNAKSPFLIIANHPNTLSDPFVVVVHMREMTFFLANYGLFKNPIASWLLNHLYCIPVKRPKDVDGTQQNNDDAFRRCDEHLQGGNNLFIASEGESYMVRHVNPLKMGAARIGFSAEAQNDFQMDLRILPVGITYDAPNYFQSRVVVNAGEMIDFRDWATAYHENRKKATEDLMIEVRKRLQDLSIHCEDGEQDAFLQKLEQVADSETKADTLTWFTRGQKWIKVLKDLKQNQPHQYLMLKNQTEAYFEHYPAAVPDDKFRLLKLIIGFPILIYGFLNNLIAGAVPYALNKIMNLYIGYHSTVKYLSSWFSVGISYYYQIKYFNAYFHNSQWTILYALSLLPAGWLAWRYYETAKLGYQARQFNQLPKPAHEAWSDLKSKMQLLFEPA